MLSKLQGRTDIPLNSTGLQQAEECGEFLKRSQWDVIITSPLKRAKHTAEIINRSLNLPLLEMDEFLERYFGDAEGLTLQERKLLYPDNHYPNEEDMFSVNTRVMAGLDKINQKYGDSKVLLVAHGAVINSILTNLSNGEIGSGKTKLENACISDIHFHQEQWKIKTFNQVSHLSQYR